MPSIRRFRALAGSLLGVCLLMPLSAAHAGTITVNNTSCTLIHAINAANLANGGATTYTPPAGGTANHAVGDCTGATAGSNTIVLTANVTLSQAYDDYGLPVVTSTIILLGNGHSVARDTAIGTPDFPLLSVTSAAGNLTIDRATLTGAAGLDAAILAEEGSSLTLLRSTLTNNNARYVVRSRNATIKLLHSTVANNVGARRSSAAVFSGASLPGLTTQIVNSSISGNSGSSQGGGLEVAGTTTTVLNSTITGNTARFYGGIYLATGSLTLRNSLVAGNTATGAGTFFVHEVGSNGVPNNITSSNNVLGHAGRTRANAFDGFTPSATDKVATSDGTVPTALASILDTTLASNGGPTQTHALVVNSPAVNASGTGATTVDQRNYGPPGDARDVGAFEFNGNPIAFAPFALSATPGNGQASIAFMSGGTPDGSAITNYAYSTNGTDFTAFNPAVTTSPVTVPGLTNGQVSTVFLRAMVGATPGVASDPVSVTPTSSEPGACNTTTTARATASAPSTELCATGTAGAVTSTGGQWAWMCNGTGGNTTNVSCAAPFQTQTITLGANPASVFVNGTRAISASSTSGLTPLLSSTTPSACSLSDTTVTGVAVGTCTVKANRAASADGCVACYQAAAEKTLDIPVTQQPQTIGPVNGVTQLNFGESATLSTSASSGLAVSYSSLTPAVCSVVAGRPVNFVLKVSSQAQPATVSPLTTGACTVAVNQAGNETFQAAPQVTHTITITAVAPSVPAGLSATPGDDRATLTFTPGSNGGSPITNYEFAVDSDVFLAFSPAVTAPPVTVFGLTNGTSHAIRIRAVSAVGPSLATEAVTVTPVIPLTQAPGQVSGEAGSGQVTIRFTAPTGSITHYEYSLNGGESFIALAAGTTSPLTLINLVNGTTYAITLRAVNGAGPGPASAALSLTPRADDDQDGVPSTIEDPVPNTEGMGTGDGNGDGIPDSQQASVSSFPELAGPNYLTVATAAGTSLVNTQPVAPPVDLPNTDRLFAGVSFTVNGLPAGSTQSIELYVPGKLGVVTGLLKKNLSTGKWDSLPIITSGVGNCTRIVYSLTDGGDYDSDRVINGSINDPVFVVGVVPADRIRGGGGVGWLALAPLLAMAALRRRRVH